MAEANSQVRRIAILVTSLDATAGRQLLMAMPAELAREVRRAMTRLTHVDPDEQRRILAEFRSQAIASPLAGAQSHKSSTSASLGTSTSANHSQSVASTVPMDSLGSTPASVRPSTTSSIDSTAVYSKNSSHPLSEPVPSPQARPWHGFDVATLTKLLRGERATVIAVVLSQLEPRQAAALLEQLPRGQHREVIGSLATLGKIDPDAMAAIDDYLASRIADYQHHDSAESETVGRLQQLLSAAPDALKADWQEIILDSDAQLAHRMGIQVKSSSEPGRSDKSSSGSNLAHLLVNNVVTTADSQMPMPAAVPMPEVAADDLVDADRDDQPHVLPFPSVAWQTTKGLTTTASSTNKSAVNPAAAATASRADAASPVIASRPSTNDGRQYPNVILEPREASTASSGAHTARGSKKTVSHDARSPLARFEHLLDLPAEMIGQTLAECDTEIVLLALAGASPTFMQRFMSMLERADARALKSRIRELGPIHLQDVDEAQRRICEVAIRIVAAAEREQAAGVSLPSSRAA